MKTTEEWLATEPWKRSNNISHIPLNAKVYCLCENEDFLNVYQGVIKEIGISEKGVKYYVYDEKGVFVCDYAAENVFTDFNELLIKLKELWKLK